MCILYMGVATAQWKSRSITAYTQFLATSLDRGVFQAHADGHEDDPGMCLSGTLDFRVGDESRELRAGETWCIPSNVPHEVRVGPDGAVVIDVFAPTRDDWRDAERVDARTPRWP